MKRVVVFRNGSNIDGKLILVTHCLEKLLTAASHKLGMTVCSLYTNHGGLIDDIALVRDDEVLYASSGEVFIAPQGSSLSPLSVHTYTHPSLKPQIHSTNEWISLNVGGRIFTTTKTTLVSKQPNSMLAKMFSDNDLVPSRVDSSGAFLIDRSYTYFEPILNYLRSGNAVMDNNINIEGVLEEAKFYGLDGLINSLEAMVEQNIPPSKDDDPLCRRDVITALLCTKPKSELRFQAVNLRRANLSKLDLRNINFKYADLSESNLSGANLSGSCLERSNLSRATLDSAQLLNVKLLCANLEGASMKCCNFEDPAGTRANCEGVNLRNAIMEGSMMAGVNLRVATLKNANLKNCDLRAAILAGADLENCDLSGSDLVEANLRGANLKHATFELMQTPLHMSQTCDL